MSARISGGRGKRSPGARVTEERIVTVALALTQRHGLMGWTMDRLAGELGVARFTINNRLGDIGTVRHAVVARVTTLIPRIPVDEDTAWDIRLRRWAGALFGVLWTSPGCAGPLAAWCTSDTGPAAPLTRQITDLLRTAGLTDAEQLARGFFATTCGLVAAEDERWDRGESRSAVGNEGFVLYGHVVDLLLDGLQVRAQQGPDPADRPWRVVRSADPPDEYA
ncbi:hypothetical protein LWP59_06000 [Amycolatopsis acidiphila]|uniref:TetR/AcrR family transcriptional regulator n=1 Tax=Amycolatopsis acidiphila TaxID=715473 RepID=A0A558AHT3_9PSEU|nr:hypothetical protein [Amycolatopsis acidiphila]TVT23833.1 hypothetical protein FNH06_08145 [Amycolatopsis acidiphila]UIJ61190.1 hypothetical protein LWP59_06000 [Amycolatopsis acidiphila]GHG99931.1 hypothetical protein GCM10017788_80460 [Amycolatopsis acidiphila]